jgi:uncharacterized protein YjgD (DUF1641 family)
MNNDLTLLHQKIDILTDQVAILTVHNEDQKRRQRELDELKQDMIPIANHMVKLTIEELAEIGDEFQIEDLFFMVKRFMRNTQFLMTMFDRLEGLMGVADEVEILGKQVFNYVVEELEKMERDGYFGFAQGGGLIVERIVKECSKEDGQGLGDTVVTILTTIRNMTQPEIMALANNAVGAIQEEIPETKSVSTWALIRELGNPSVRRGMARMINILKALDEQVEIKK